MHNVMIEISVVNMETLDLANAVAVALANSPDINSNSKIHRIIVEEADA